jgi:hypothetical protein
MDRTHIACIMARGLPARDIHELLRLYLPRNKFIRSQGLLIGPAMRYFGAGRGLYLSRFAYARNELPSRTNIATGNPSGARNV